MHTSHVIDPAARLQPYRPRPIRFLDLWEEGGWRIKVYGICSVGEVPEPRFVDAARALARETLPRPAVTADRYGLAFVAVHQAEMFNQIIVDWWERVNELRHRVFKAEPEDPTAFRDITATGEAFCVWELRVLGFERVAWLETMLKNLAGPDADAYLECRLDEEA